MFLEFFVAPESISITTNRGISQTANGLESTMIKKIIEDAISQEPSESKDASQNSAVNRVNDYIKKLIVLGKLKAGDRIPTEVELCQLLDVSRGSVREAMKILEALSIIKISRGNGTFISQVDEIHSMESTLFKIILSDTSISELVEFREEIEFAVLNIVAKKITIAEKDALYTNIEKTKECAANENCDPVELYELDNQFHELLAKATHNLMIQEVYRFTHEIIAPMLLKNYKLGQSGNLTVISHQLTMEAVERRDFHLMGAVVKNINEIWMQSHYGRMKESSLLDREVLNAVVMRNKTKD